MIINLLSACTDAGDEKLQFAWNTIPPLPPPTGQEFQPGLAGPVVGFAGSHLLVAGGANFPDSLPWKGGKKVYHQMAYLLNTAENQSYTWIVSSVGLPFPLAYSANVTLPRGVLVIGGENQEGPVKSVFLISDRDGVLKIFPQPDLPMAVTAGAAALVGKTVYLIGGSTGAHETTACLSLDTETPGAGWQQLADLPVPLSHAVVVARDDGSGKCIYALGGRHRIENKTIFSGTVWKYRIHDDSWMEDAGIQDESGAVVLAAGTGIAAGKHSIVLFGGDHGAIFSLTEQLNQQIGEAEDSTVKASLISRKDSILTNHPGFSNRILVYNVRTRKWSAGGEMPRPAPVTTNACQWNGRVFIPSGEIRPGVRTPQVLCTKIKTE